MRRNSDLDPIVVLTKNMNYKDEENKITSYLLSTCGRYHQPSACARSVLDSIIIQNPLYVTVGEFLSLYLIRPVNKWIICSLSLIDYVENLEEAEQISSFNVIIIPLKSKNPNYELN